MTSALLPQTLNSQGAALFVCVLLYMVLGFLWYSPVLFGKRWLKLVDASKMDKSAMPRCLGISLLSAVAMSVVLTVFIQMMPAIDTTLDAAKLAFVLWGAFIATTFGTSYAYTGKPMELFLIDAGYPLACMLMISVVTTMM